MITELKGGRILLADDHAMVRLGFRLLLEGAGAEVVAETGNGESVVHLYATFKPNVVVMDVSMPGIGGLEALERLLAWDGKARVLMLSAHNDEVVPLCSLRLGARGYLCNRAAQEEFLRAFCEVASDRRYLDPSLAQAIAFAQLNSSNSPIQALTDKELAVFLKLAAGQSVIEVAEAFCLSPSTVGTHLYHIKQKLNVQNGSELTLLAMRNSLIES